MAGANLKGNSKGDFVARFRQAKQQTLKRYESAIRPHKGRFLDYFAKALATGAVISTAAIVIMLYVLFIIALWAYIFPAVANAAPEKEMPETAPENQPAAQDDGRAIINVTLSLKDSVSKAFSAGQAWWITALFLLALLIIAVYTGKDMASTRFLKL